MNMHDNLQRLTDRIEDNENTAKIFAMQAKQTPQRKHEIVDILNKAFIGQQYRVYDTMMLRLTKIISTLYLSRDERMGITRQTGVHSTIRDSRGVKYKEGQIPPIDNPESYFIQQVNVARAAMYILQKTINIKYPGLNADQYRSTTQGQALQNLMIHTNRMICDMKKSIMVDIHTDKFSDPKYQNIVRKFNNEICAILKSAGITNVKKNLNTAKDMMGAIYDESTDVITITDGIDSTGKKCAKIEIDTLLVGLSKAQRKQFSAIINAEKDNLVTSLEENGNYNWYTKLNMLERKLALDYMAKALDDKPIRLSSQVLDFLPVGRNLSVSSGYILGPESEELKLMGTISNSGVPSYGGKGDQALATKMIIDQLATFNLSNQKVIDVNLMSSANVFSPEHELTENIDLESKRRQMQEELYKLDRNIELFTNRCIKYISDSDMSGRHNPMCEYLLNSSHVSKEEAIEFYDRPLAISDSYDTVSLENDDGTIEQKKELNEKFRKQQEKFYKNNLRNALSARIAYNEVIEKLVKNTSYKPSDRDLSDIRTRINSFKGTNESYLSMKTVAEDIAYVVSKDSDVEPFVMLEMPFNPFRLIDTVRDFFLGRDKKQYEPYTKLLNNFGSHLENFITGKESSDKSHSHTLLFSVQKLLDVCKYIKEGGIKPDFDHNKEFKNREGDVLSKHQLAILKNAYNAREALDKVTLKSAIKDLFYIDPLNLDINKWMLSVSSAVVEKRGAFYNDFSTVRKNFAKLHLHCKSNKDRAGQTRFEFFRYMFNLFTGITEGSREDIINLQNQAAGGHTAFISGNGIGYEGMNKDSLTRSFNERYAKGLRTNTADFNEVESKITQEIEQLSFIRKVSNVEIVEVSGSISGRNKHLQKVINDVSNFINKYDKLEKDINKYESDINNAEYNTSKNIGKSYENFDKFSTAKGMLPIKKKEMETLKKQIPSIHKSAESIHKDYKLFIFMKALRENSELRDKIGVLYTERVGDPNIITLGQDSANFENYIKSLDRSPEGFKAYVTQKEAKYIKDLLFNNETDNKASFSIKDVYENVGVTLEPTSMLKLTVKSSTEIIDQKHINKTNLDIIKKRYEDINKFQHSPCTVHSEPLQLLTIQYSKCKSFDSMATKFYDALHMPGPIKKVGIFICNQPKTSLAAVGLTVAVALNSPYVAIGAFAVIVSLSASVVASVVASITHSLVVDPLRDFSSKGGFIGCCNYFSKKYKSPTITDLHLLETTSLSTKLEGKGKKRLIYNTSIFPGYKLSSGESPSTPFEI
jgi:hypothetical protein